MREELPSRSSTDLNELINRRISHATLLLAIIMVLLIVSLAMSIITASSIRVGGSDVPVLVTFSINGVLSLAMLVVESLRRPFSLAMIHWIFYICFFVVAPVCQYINGYSCWDYLLSDDLMLMTNFILLIWGGTFAIFSNLSTQRKIASPRTRRSGRIQHRIKMTTKRAALLILASAISVAALVWLVGIENLFSRSTYDLGLDQTLSLVVDKVLRATPLFALVFIIAGDERHPLIVILGVSLLLIADFPTGMARYNAAVIYGGLSLLLFPAMRKKGIFPIVFLVAFLVLFPAINTFRANELSLIQFVAAIEDSIKNIPVGFCAGDYDAYSMLARSIQYVERWGTTNGGQLLTALLFFVPRSIWPAKAMGSGSTIADAQGQEFTNLSCPLPAEGIINFGNIGLVLLAITFGAVCKLVDDCYWNEGEGMQPRGLSLFYPFLCMFYFFMMRGDLLSSTAYLVGYAAVFIVMYFLLSRDKSFGQCQ